MYICICNALNEKKVDDAIANGADRPGRVYEHHGCKVRCGKCVSEVAERLASGTRELLSQPTGLPVIETGAV